MLLTRDVHVSPLFRRVPVIIVVSTESACLSGSPVEREQLQLLLNKEE